MNTIHEALVAIYNGQAKYIQSGDDYAGLDWLDEVIPKPTEAEINAKISELNAEQPFKICKEKAKKIIEKSDWAALPDVGLANQSEFIAYRVALRALIITPVADPVWPTEPTPIWE
jgi:hypothetical protein